MSLASAYIDVVFDRLPGGPDAEARFIETEDQRGRSVGRDVGLEWVNRRDGSHALRVSVDSILRASAACGETKLGGIVPGALGAGTVVLEFRQAVLERDAMRRRLDTALAALQSIESLARPFGGCSEEVDADDIDGNEEEAAIDINARNVALCSILTIIRLAKSALKKEAADG